MRSFGSNTDKEIDVLKKKLKTSIYVNIFLTVLLCCGFYLMTTLKLAKYDLQINQLANDLYSIDYATSSDLSTVDGKVTTLSSNLTDIRNTVNAQTDAIDNLSSALNGVVASVNDMIRQQNEVTFEPKVATEEESVQEYAVYTNGVIKSDGYVTRDYFEEVVSYYNMVPAHVRAAFETDGWHVEVVSTNIRTKAISTSDTIAALTVFESKTIYISIYDSVSIIHEMGHYLDYKHNFCSTNLNASTYASDLNGFYMLDGDTHVHNYSTTPEYFAESFMLYIMRPEEFRQYCPGTYDFITEALNL